MDADKPRDVDALIDGVARAMTGGEPSDGLRAAVRRRIDGPVPKTAAWRPWVVAGATAAIVIVAVVWQLNDRAAVRHVPDRSAADVQAPARPDAVAAPRAAAVMVSPSQRASADRPAPRADRQVARQSQAPAGEPSTVEIAPLAIEPLRPAALVADTDTGRPLADIEIDPIPIRPLAIGPLASDDLE